MQGKGTTIPVGTARLYAIALHTCRVKIANYAQHISGDLGQGGQTSVISGEDLIYRLPWWIEMKKNDYF